ncbi:sigma-70 family RNA polymerase sigma factor [Flindersiella endophytica]
MSDANPDFVRLADPYRRELLAFCYRMLGSLHDAEDLVQETYLRAWRAYSEFEGRASMRTWLYRIATNACLRALENAQRRALPSALGAPSSDPHDRLTRAPEVPWLEPIPDLLFVGAPVDPAAAAVSRESMRLAFVAALQHLPARQRAVLILRDVLQWPAAEVAALLDMSRPAINSALQRARATLASLSLSEDSVAEPSEPERKSMLERYVRAFEAGDMKLLTSLLAEAVVLEMPPAVEYFAGRATVLDFLATRVPRAHRFRMLPAGANGQPAVLAYVDDEVGAYLLHSVQVLSMSKEGISHITVFFGRDCLRAFGTPDRIDG